MAWRASGAASATAPATRALRATIPLPEGLKLDGVGAPEIALSPDGQWVAFAVGASAIAGGGIPTELRKYSVDTGLTQTIAPIDDYFGGVWRVTLSSTTSVALASSLDRCVRVWLDRS